MTDAELFAIYQEAGNPAKARRALFEAGRQAERDGEDDLTDTDDFLRSLKRDYRPIQQSKDSAQGEKK